MSTSDSLFHHAVQHAGREAEATEDLALLPEAVRTVALLYAAQGLIDNGGLSYFFESDFPHQPPYAFFVAAYEAIGAHAQASLLRQAVECFPFPAPHLHAARRNEFLRTCPLDGLFERLSDALYGDKQVWTLLEAFIERNARELGVSSGL